MLFSHHLPSIVFFSTDKLYHSWQVLPSCGAVHCSFVESCIIKFASDSSVFLNPAGLQLSEESSLLVSF